MGKFWILLSINWLLCNHYNQISGLHWVKISPFPPYQKYGSWDDFKSSVKWWVTQGFNAYRSKTFLENHHSGVCGCPHLGEAYSDLEDSLYTYTILCTTHMQTTNRNWLEWPDPGVLSVWEFWFWLFPLEPEHFEVHIISLTQIIANC